MKAGTVKNKRDFSVKRIFRLVNSHVKIKVSGVNAEKFINICLRRNIDIWDVERGDGFFSLCMSIKAFKRNIRQIARKTGCKVKITERSGALIVRAVISSEFLWHSIYFLRRLLYTTVRL